MDLGNTANANVQIRLVPLDLAGPGIAVTTNAFAVDNSASQAGEQQVTFTPSPGFDNLVNSKLYPQARKFTLVIDGQTYTPDMGYDPTGCSIATPPTYADIVGSMDSTAAQMQIALESLATVNPNLMGAAGRITVTWVNGTSDPTTPVPGGYFEVVYGGRWAGIAHTIAQGISQAQTPPAPAAGQQPTPDFKYYGTISVVTPDPIQNLPPAAAVVTPAGVQGNNVTIGYSLFDAASHPCNIQVQYSPDGGATWYAASADSGGEGTMNLSATPNGTAHSFVWNSFADLGNTANASVQIRIVPIGIGGPGTVGMSNAFTVANITSKPPLPITPPTATITTPAAPQSGNVTLEYSLFDADSAPSSILVYYSLDGGHLWQTATAGFGGDGNANLTSTPTGTAHNFIWNSLADLGNTANANVQIRIVPFDPGRLGTVATTSAFAVDNSASQAGEQQVTFTPTPGFDDEINSKLYPQARKFTLVVDGQTYTPDMTYDPTGSIIAIPPTYADIVQSMQITANEMQIALESLATVNPNRLGAAGDITVTWVDGTSNAGSPVPGGYFDVVYGGRWAGIAHTIAKGISQAKTPPPAAAGQMPVPDFMYYGSVSVVTLAPVPAQPPAASVTTPAGRKATT